MQVLAQKYRRVFILLPYRETALSSAAVKTRLASATGMKLSL